MSLVVDASVVVKWFVEEALSEQAEALLDAGEPLFAPELLLAEVANTLWKKVGRGEIGPEQARRAAERCEAGVPTLQPIRPLHARALDIALDLDHPVYDCLYVACAEATGGVVVTADERFVRAAAGTDVAPLVRHLSAAAAP